LSQRKLTQRETKFIQESLGVDYQICDIRLREGEYQHTLAKGIASFQLELRFPDVKDIIRRLYGEEKSDDIQFVRKIQTILKKMEKSNVARILPKKKPWELQRYALSSFKFEDIDRNRVNLATDQQMKRTQNLLDQIMSKQETLTTRPTMNKIKIFTLAFIVVVASAAILWNVTQPSINPFVFIIALSFAAICSLALGKMLTKIGI